MPGPKANLPRKPGPRDVPTALLDSEGKPIWVKRTSNKKQAKRLAARQASFNAGNSALGLLCHKPGSQNRKK